MTPTTSEAETRTPGTRTRRPAPRQPRPEEPPAALSWRIIRDGPRPGATNMALDHALATESVEGEAVLRLYGWTRPTVSFGRNEPARGRYGAAAAGTAGEATSGAAGDITSETAGEATSDITSETGGEDVDWVRRPTGGRAVLHDAELTYAVVAPAGALGGPRLAYRRINEALAGALASLGAPVALSGPAAVPTLDAGPCFQSPAEGEVTTEGRKLVGSAQARVEGVLLQHGSILLAGDQMFLEALRTSATATPGGAYTAPATLSDLVPAVSFEEVSDAVVRHMQKTFDGAWRTDEYRQTEVDTAIRLETERYGTEAWTWRR